MARSQARSTLLKLGLATLSAVAALGGAELCLRRVLPRATRYYVWEPSLERVLHPRPELVPGVRGPSVFRTSSIGLRADELTPAHDVRILAVGGSTTECLLLDQDEAWPELVRGALAERFPERGIWVGNAGSSGRHARDHVVQLRHLLPQLGPLDVVVLLVGVNDLMLPLAQGAAFDPGYLDRPGAEGELLRRAFRVLPLAVDERGPAWKRTALWRAGASLRDAFFPSALVQDGEGVALERWREHRRRAPAVRAELPDLEPALREYRRNVRTLIRACRAHGARVVCATQPHLWRPDLPAELAALCWMGGVGRYQEQPGAEYYSIAALARGMGRYNAALIELCGELEVACVDLEPLLPKDERAFYDDVHVNEDGARRMAAALAAELAAGRPFVPAGDRVADPDDDPPGTLGQR